MEQDQNGTLDQIYAWSTGNGTYMYHTLLQCLGGDLKTAIVILILCAGITMGYCVIAYRWFSAAKELPSSRGKQAFST